MRISTTITMTEVVAMLPRISGVNVPLMPASTVDSRMYVIKDMIGIYMSGELRSSLGGRYIWEYCREV